MWISFFSELKRKPSLTDITLYLSILAWSNSQVTILLQRWIRIPWKYHPLGYFLFRFCQNLHYIPILSVWTVLYWTVFKEERTCKTVQQNQIMSLGRTKGNADKANQICWERFLCSECVVGWWSKQEILLEFVSRLLPHSVLWIDSNELWVEKPCLFHRPELCWGHKHMIKETLLPTKCTQTQG